MLADLFTRLSINTNRKNVFTLLIALFASVVGLRAENKITRIEIFYINPYTNTGSALSVDDLPKMAAGKHPGISTIRIEGGQVVADVQSVLRDELTLPQTSYWLMNSIDARIVFRFYSSDTEFRQLTFANAKRCQWNNLPVTFVSEKKRKTILSLLPHRLFESL